MMKAKNRIASLANQGRLVAPRELDKDATSRYVKRVKPAKLFLSESDKTALAKAEAKRAMRAAKLLKTTGVTL